MIGSIVRIVLMPTRRKMSKTLEELMSVKLLSEIVEEMEACETTESLISVMTKNQSPAFRAMLQYVFYPGVQFSVTELPKFRPDPAPIGLSPTSLFVEMRRFYVLLETKKISVEKKSKILEEICESVHPTEAALVGRIIKRDLGIPLLTYDLVRQVWPTLLPE